MSGFMQLGFSMEEAEKRIKAQIGDNSDDIIQILSIINAEFKFLMLHGLDLLKEGTIEWSSLKVKLELLRPEVDYRLLCYVFEAYALYARNKSD